MGTVLPAAASAAGPPPAGGLAVVAVAAAGNWGRAGPSTGVGADQGQAEYGHHTPQAEHQTAVTKTKQTDTKCKKHSTPTTEL